MTSAASSMTSSFVSAFVGTLIDTPTLGEIRIRRDHVLAIDSEGLIAYIGQESDAESRAILDSLDSGGVAGHPAITRLPAGTFLLPTFTDLHLHAPQYLYAGTGLDLPLMSWLDKYAYRAEERIDADPQGLGRQVYSRLADRLKSVGTGCVVCFGTIGAEANLVLAEELAKAGLRGYVGKLSMDQSPRPTYGEASAHDSLQAVDRFLDAMMAVRGNDRRLVRPILTPRFVPTCSDELLRGLATIARDRGVWVQSHMCESTDQMQWVESQRGKKDEVVFDEAGLLGPSTVQAHVTSLPASLIHLVKERGVTIAHCPLSNAYFSDAKFPLRESLDADLKVGLGSDIAGGYAMSIQHAMRHAVVTARHREGDRQERLRVGEIASGSNLRVDWQEALYVGTRGGKRALGLGGYFDPGMEFDAQHIQLVTPATPLGVGPLDLFRENEAETSTDAWILESLERWWCNGDDRNLAAMWIQGQKIR